MISASVGVLPRPPKEVVTGQRSEFLEGINNWRDLKTALHKESKFGIQNKFSGQPGSSNIGGSEQLRVKFT
jgi:hypothetical protein